MKNYFIQPSPGQTQMMALIYFIFGIILCFFGSSILLGAARVLGIVMVVYGIYLLYLYFGKRANTSTVPLIEGLPTLVIGLVIAISPAALVSIFPVVIAILIIFNSIVQMQKSFILKDMHDPSWMMGLVFSIIMLLAGIILLLRPIQALSYVLKVVGVVLIVEAIFMLIQSFQEKKYMH